MGIKERIPSDLRRRRNKRIGATIFLYFLNMNNALYKNGKERINNDALAILTILVASSRPEDKEIMIQLIKTIIK